MFHYNPTLFHISAQSKKRVLFIKTELFRPELIGLLFLIVQMEDRAQISIANFFILRHKVTRLIFRLAAASAKHPPQRSMAA